MKRLLLMLLTIAILLIGISVVSCLYFFDMRESTQQRKQSRILLYRQSDLYTVFQDMDLASRGYSLSHEPKSLDAYQSKEKEYRQICSDLQRLTADNPVQQKNLARVLVSAKEFDDATRIMFDAIDAKPLRRRQKEAMDGIKQSLHSIVGEENRLLQERQARTDTYYVLGWISLCIQLIVGLILLYYSWRLLKQYEKENTEKLVQLKTAKELAERALEAKTRFLATVSHEVRTPMAGVIGLTELLSLQELGADNNETVGAILDSSKQLLQILNSILEAARLDVGKITLEYRNFSVRPVLGDVRQLIAPDATKKHLAVTGFCDEKIPAYVYGDEFRVRQILINLSFNAVKFTDSGRVEITAALKESTAEKTVIRFSITDTGIGISAADQKRIFQPFEQAADATKRIAGGTGLGLSIAKELVELMSGEIGVTSEPGEGSTFWFEVPFLADRPNL
jgi:signal transduction histidine kinase